MTSTATPVQTTTPQDSDSFIAEPDALRAQIAALEAEVLRLQGSEIGLNRYSAKVNAENKALREQLSDAQSLIGAVQRSVDKGHADSDLVEAWETYNAAMKGAA
jgi:hypothetical protein